MPGQHAGKAIADILAETLRKHSEATSDARMEEGIAHRTEQAERWEAELRDVLRPAIAALVNGDDHEEMTELVHNWIVNPDHQVQLAAVAFALVPLVMGFVEAYEQPWLRSIQHTVNAGNPNDTLGVSDYAEAVMRGVLDEATGEIFARNIGIAPEQFAIMRMLVGNPPGPEEILELQRRGVISSAQTTQGLKESRLRDEWIPIYEQLIYGPPTASEAISAAVQGHMTPDEAQAIAQENGLNPKYFQALLDTAGNPPGVQTLIELWRRGKITQEQVEAGIREGRTKDKYITPLLATKEAIPPERSVPTLVSTGAATEAQGITWLEWHGYEPATAKAMIEAHKSSTAAGHKHLAVSQILAYYGDGEWDKAQAEARIVALGYTSADAGVLIELQDLKTRKATEGPAISKARTLYLTRRADAAEVSTLLDAAGVPASVRTQYLKVWEAELKASIAILTPSQVLSAWKFNVIQHAECLSRLQAHGYSTADAELLMNIERHAPKFVGE